MSRLGEVHVQVDVRGQALRGRISVAGAEAEGDLGKALPELTTALESLGFGPVALGCQRLARPLVERLRDAMLEGGALRGSSLLDVVA